ncbi:MAG: hypothetical protein RIC12_01610 [Pirellulales bacterium]
MVTNRISPFMGHYQESQPLGNVVERLVDFLCTLDDLTFARIVQLARQISRASAGSRTNREHGRRIEVDDWVIPLRKDVDFDLGQVVSCVGQQQVRVRWYQSPQDTFEDADRLIAGYELVQAVRLAKTKRQPMQESQPTETLLSDDQGLVEPWADMLVNLREFGIGLCGMSRGLFQMTFGAAFGLGQDLYIMATSPFRKPKRRRDDQTDPLERRWN